MTYLRLGTRDMIGRVPTMTIVVFVLLIAFWLRCSDLFNPAFHADEALFATWSRKIHALHDPFLVGETADKPPLLFYLQSLTYNLLTSAQFASRIPNLIASMLLIPLTARFGRTPRQTLLIMIIIAIHPLAIRYSATAFTDPLMLMWCMAAVLATFTTKTPHSFKSGLLFGLAIATKYHALILLPLIIGVGLLKRWQWRDWMRWLLGLSCVTIILLAWLSISFNETGFGQTGDALLLKGVRPIHQWELLPRFHQWRLIAPLTIGIVWGIVKKEAADRLFATFIVAYCALLWLVALPVYERYLLLIIPWVAVGIGRIATRYQNLGYVMAVMLGMMVCLIQPVNQRPTHDYTPIITALEEQPPHTVLYDHYISWQLRYFLYDQYDVYVAWIPHPSTLINDLDAFYTDEAARFIILPASSRPFFDTLESAGYTLYPHETVDTLTLYQMRVVR